MADDPQFARSQKALAAELGVARYSVQRWFKREDWPFGHRGPYPIAAIRAWRERVLKRHPNGKLKEPLGDTTEELKRQLLREQIQKARRENQHLAGELVEREEVAAELRGVLATLRSGLMAAAEALPRTMQAQGMLRKGKRGDAVRLSTTVFRQLAEQLQRDLRRLSK